MGTEQCIESNCTTERDTSSSCDSLHTPSSDILERYSKDQPVMQPPTWDPAF